MYKSTNEDKVENTEPAWRKRLEEKSIEQDLSRVRGGHDREFGD